MTIQNPAILAALAEREKLQSESLVLQGRARKVQELIEAARIEQGALATLDATDAAEMTRWAAAGCNGDAPVSDSKARDAALRKVVAGNARAAAAESTLLAITAEHLAVSERLGPLNAAVDAAVADHLLALWQTQHAEMRALEDRLEVARTVAAATWSRARNHHAGLAGQGAAAVDAAQREWFGSRPATVAAAADVAWRAIAATIPE